MILFKLEHILPIIDGRKTVTRRIWAKGCRVKVGSIQKAKLNFYAPKSFALLKILKVFKQKLGEMTDTDAYHEGYDDIDSFKKVWKKINRCKWDDNQEVYVIHFKVVKDNSAHFI